MTAVIKHMAEVLKALPPIGKNQRNVSQNFDFRGIDDVLNAINPLLGEHGLVIIPRVIERIADVRRTKQGNDLYVVNLHVRFTVHCAEDGSSLTGSAWGEGTDSGDKATNKAMTGAFKYFLFEAFAISTKEAADNDADRVTPPETGRQVFECPRCEEAGTHFEHIDREKFRDHMVTKHSYVRLEDGRVALPTTDETPPQPADPGPQPGPKEYPDDGGRPLDPPKTDGPDVTRETAESELTPAILRERAHMVAGMTKQLVVKELTEVDLSTSGNLAALRQRLSDYYTALAIVGEGSAPEEADSEPPQAGDGTYVSDADRANAEAFNIPVELFAEDGKPHQCPECDTFPFASEGQYQAHWYESHDPDRPTQDAPQGPAEVSTPQDPESVPGAPQPQTETAPADEDDGTPAPEELIVEIKAAIGKLSGDGARAYARYRRENSVPPPSQLTFVQAVRLVDWLEEIAPATV